MREIRQFLSRMSRSDIVEANLTWGEDWACIGKLGPNYGLTYKEEQLWYRTGKDWHLALM